MRRVGLVILAFIFLGLFSDISGAATTCTPPVSGAWIIPPGVTCTFNGQTIDVPGSTINPYVSATSGINVYVGGTLDITGGALNLNDPTSLGSIEVVGNGKLYLKGTRLTTKSSQGGVGISHYSAGVPSAVMETGYYPGNWPPNNQYTYVSGTTFLDGDFYGGTIDVVDSTITWYIFNEAGDAKTTLTRVNAPSVAAQGGSMTVLNSVISSLSTGFRGYLTVPTTVTVKDSTIEGVRINGATTADFTNVAVKSHFQLMGDSTTTISNSPSLNEVYVWSNSWMSPGGNPVVSVINSKVKTLVTTIGGSTNLDVDGMGTADGSYKLYPSKIIQSSNTRYRIELTNTEVANYNFYSFGDWYSSFGITGNGVARISNSYVLAGEITGSSDVTFDNSVVYGMSYIYGNANVKFISSSLERFSTYPYLSFYGGTPTVIFDKSTLGKGSTLLVWGSTNALMKGNLSLGTPGDPVAGLAVYVDPDSTVSREYPVYLGYAGTPVSVKDMNGNIVWSGTSNSDKWVYPVVVFDSANYQQKFTLVSGLESAQFDFWTSTPIQLTWTILTPAQATQNLITQVQKLGPPSGPLNQGQVNASTAKLNAALNSLNAGNSYCMQPVNCFH